MSLHSLTAPDNSILPNTVAVLSVLGTLAGLTSLIDPFNAIPQFGLSFPMHNDKKSMALAVALTRVYGVRNMSMGLINLALWYNGRNSTSRLAWRHALGWAMILNVATPLVDGVMCEVQGRTSGWKHWVFVPFTVVVGAGLLYQF